MACTKTRNTGTPRNAGTPEHRNTPAHPGTPEQPGMTEHRNTQTTEKKKPENEVVQVLITDHVIKVF